MRKLSLRACRTELDWWIWVTKAMIAWEGRASCRCFDFPYFMSDEGEEYLFEEYASKAMRLGPECFLRRP